MGPTETIRGISSTDGRLLQTETPFVARLVPCWKRMEASGSSLVGFANFVEPWIISFGCRSSFLHTKLSKTLCSGADFILLSCLSSFLLYTKFSKTLGSGQWTSQTRSYLPHTCGPFPDVSRKHPFFLNVTSLTKAETSVRERDFLKRAPIFPYYIHDVFRPQVIHRENHILLCIFSPK